MRVLSPKIEPPCKGDEGSTARTPTRFPRPIRNSPKASIKVDLPTPGTPEMPILRLCPLCGRQRSRSAAACLRCDGWLDSISVMALASARRWPLRSASKSISGTGVLNGIENRFSTGWDLGSGTKNRGNTLLIERLIIFSWNDAAGEDDNIISTFFGERCFELWNQCQVTSCQRADTDGMNIILDGLTRDFFGCGKHGA